MATTQRIAGTITGQAGSLKAFLDTNLPLLGWSLAFTGTNKSVYRQGIEVNNKQRARTYLWINDDGPTAGSFREARVVMAESASGVELSNLNDLVPTIAQAATNLSIRKSNTLDAVTRNTILIGNERSFYLLIQSGDSTTEYAGSFFGDYVPIVKDEQWPTIIIARSTENTATASNDRLAAVNNNIATILTGHHLVRDVNGYSKSININKAGDAIKSGSGTFLGNGGLAFPNPANGLPVFSDIALINSNSISYFGTMPGVIYPCHNKPFSNNDTFIFNGKNYEVFNVMSGGQLCIETSNTWEI